MHDRTSSFNFVAISEDQVNSDIDKLALEKLTFDIQEGDILKFASVTWNPQDTLDTFDTVCGEKLVGAVALVDLTIHEDINLLKSFCEAIGLAYISVLRTPFGGESNESFNSKTSLLSESPAVAMVDVIRAVVLKENLSNIVIFFDKTFDIANNPRRILNNLPSQHLYREISNNDTEMAALLSNLTEMQVNNFFFLSNATSAAGLLSEANKIGMMTEKNRWFIVTKDTTITCGECKDETKVLTFTGNSDIVRRGAYVDVMQKKYSSHFQDQSIEMDMAFLYDILVWTKEILDNQTQLSVRNVSDCFSSNQNKSPRSITEQSENIISAFKKGAHPGVFGDLEYMNGMIVQHLNLSIKRSVFSRGQLESFDGMIGWWTKEDGLHVAEGKQLITSLKKRKYKVTTVSGFPPFIFKDANNTYSGYCKDLLDKIADIMDFEYTITECPDGKYGAINDNGSWNGVMNELIKKNADIAIGPIAVMTEREHFVDFTVPYYDPVGLTILMKKQLFEYKLTKFLTVLDAKVWLCITAAFFLFSILLSFFDKISPFSYQNNKDSWSNRGSEPRVFSLKEGVWFCMMSLTPQGGGEAPRALSGRMLAATWWLFGFIIIATYTANLAAFLTVLRLDTPIKSLDDLSKQSTTKYAPLQGSSAEIYFRRMKDIELKFFEIWKRMSLNDSLSAVEKSKLAVWDYPVSDVYTKMWDRINDAGFFKTLEEAKQKVKEESFAYIGDATSNKHTTLTNCDLWEVGEEFSRKPFAFAVQQGSPLKTEISNAILNLLNQRVLEDLRNEWWKSVDEDCPRIEDESDGLSINNIGGVFLVVAIGTAASFLTLLLECYWYRFRVKGQHKLYDVRSATSTTLDRCSTAGTSVTNLSNGFSLSVVGLDKEEEESKENNSTSYYTYDDNVIFRTGSFRENDEDKNVVHRNSKVHTNGVLPNNNHQTETSERL